MDTCPVMEPTEADGNVIVSSTLRVHAGAMKPKLIARLLFRPGRLRSPDNPYNPAASFVFVT